MSSSCHLNEAQKDGEERGAGTACGRNCLSRCCLLQGVHNSYANDLRGACNCQGPFYLFIVSAKWKRTQIAAWRRVNLTSLTDFLKSCGLPMQWDDCKARGLFHHDISACETKILPGRYGFITQLIEGRDLKKRPTEFRIDKVLQPFDPNKFNFTKIGQAEVLFRFEESESDETGFYHNASITASESPNVIAINVSPIGYAHVLLIPRVLDYLPQRLDNKSFLLALYMAKEAKSPYFRVGYNSLGAFATVNHLHFQAFYLMETFPVEKATTQTIATLADGVEILQLIDYPVRGLVFGGARNLEDLSIIVSTACIFLQDNDIPYNVLISDSGRRIFLLLQCFAEKRVRAEISKEFLETLINPAAWELAGYIVMKRRKDFEEASEDIVLSFLAETSVSAQRFEVIKQGILETLPDKIVKNNVERENN